MKLPGKRNRMRKASTSEERAALSSNMKPPIVTAALILGQTPAPPLPESTRALAESLGPRLALAPARAFRAPLAWAAFAYLLAVGALHVAQQETGPKPAIVEASASTPTAKAEEPPAAELDPLLAIEDPESGAPGEPPRLAAERLAGPLPPAAASVAGDGAQALLEALSRVPTPPLMVRRELTRLGLDPDASASDDALAWVRACEPAVTALARVACCERFDSSKIAASPSSSLDLRALHDLAVAALCVGRMDTRGGAPALGAAPALDLVQLGHGLGRCASPVEAAAGVALARLGERWLARSLERDPWSREELEWLQGRLAPISDARRGLSRASAPGARPADGIDVDAALARATTQELGALAALAARCAQKLEPPTTGLADDRTEGGVQ